MRCVCVICVMFVFICVFCWEGCPCSGVWAVCGEMVVVCVCVSCSGVGDVGVFFLLSDVVTCRGACVRGAACCGWYWEPRDVCEHEC